MSNTRQPSPSHKMILTMKKSKSLDLKTQEKHRELSNVWDLLEKRADSRKSNESKIKLKSLTKTKKDVGNPIMPTETLSKSHKALKQVSQRKEQLETLLEQLKGTALAATTKKTTLKKDPRKKTKKAAKVPKILPPYRQESIGGKSDRDSKEPLLKFTDTVASRLSSPVLATTISDDLKSAIHGEWLALQVDTYVKIIGICETYSKLPGVVCETSSIPSTPYYNIRFCF
jgi:hypothetical protein